ncbi:sensor domain-containing diguanylate cyclase [Alteraurantiacibacter palmitatis]|uniref:diguanylate cyclase n=1 Tax=Alteraurantiacibacter palmitatis TaxID=2054628 RepID=A0ABV7E387_9SPHN
MTGTIGHLAATTGRRLTTRSSANSGKLLLATAFLLGVLLALSGWLARDAIREMREAAHWQSKAFEVIDAINGLRVGVVSIRRGERGYLLTSDPTYLEPYVEGRVQIAQSFEKLQRETRPNPELAIEMQRMEGAIEAYLAQASGTVELERQGRHAEAVSMVRSGTGRQLTNNLLGQLDRFEASERELLAQRKARAEQAAARSEKAQIALNVTGLLLLVVGLFASLALRRAIANEEQARAELKWLATTDELTGLANRREMFAGLDRLIAAARRQKRPLAVAVIDIDRFKLVNDTHGHSAGDEVIRCVAQMGLALMREQDLMGRLGGEEFLIAFPDCAAEDAAAACERLREGIAALPIILPEGKALAVTISIGVAALLPDDDRTRLISRADEALYRAKKGGRDQVSLAA